MTQFTFWFTIFSFIFTMVLIFWRPKGINEAIPATIGAILIFLCGSVSLADIADIGSKVTGAAVNHYGNIGYGHRAGKYWFFSLGN